jgi:hypothetical protein
LLAAKNGIASIAQIAASSLLLGVRITGFAGYGTRSIRVAFAGIAGKSGGAFELGAGFEVAA